MSILNESKFQIAELTVINQALQQKIQDFKEEISNLKHLNKKINDQLQELKIENDHLKCNQQKQGTFMIEVEHLRSDNQRLIQLLNGGNKGDLRFLSALQTEKSELPECLFWVPQKAFEVAHQIKDKFSDSDYLGDKQIQLLLFELNKIWAVRQFDQQKLQQAKVNLEKRKLIQKNEIPYKDFQLIQEVDRLKCQIKDLKKENMDLYANRPERGIRSIRAASVTIQKK